MITEISNDERMMLNVVDENEQQTKQMRSKHIPTFTQLCS